MNRSNVTIVVVGVVATLAALALLAFDGSDNQPQPEPGPVVVGKPEHEPPVDPGLDEAERVAWTFIRSYLPVTTGRARPASVQGATARLRAQIAREQRTARIPPAQRAARPRVANLTVVAQGPGAAQAAAEITDRGTRWVLVYYPERQPDGAWKVVRIGND